MAPVSFWFHLLATPGEVAHALLRKQFFPNVKSNNEELPPIFSSDSLSDEIAGKLATTQPLKAAYAPLRVRRFDGLVRNLGVPHPVPFSKLVRHISDNWNELEGFLLSSESQVKPLPPQRDGRMLVMNYAGPQVKAVSDIKAAQGKRYVVHADISNCFPSIYSHSIDWALRGLAIAKADTRGKCWERTLDTLNQNCHYGETKGVMIGPAAFNFVSEIVLQAIDSNLRQNFLFVRYIDDYTAYFDSQQEAENFLSTLDRELSKYRLQLNTRKTKVSYLAHGFGESWISEVTSHLPRSRGALEAIRFLQQSERIAAHHPTRSVLTYAVKALLSLRKCPALGVKKAKQPAKSGDLAILQEILRICFWHPHLAPLAARQVSYCLPIMSSHDRSHFALVIRGLLTDSIRRGETDTCLWFLYILRKQLKRKLPSKIAKKIPLMADGVAILGLAITSKRHMSEVTSYARTLSSSDVLTLHENWLLRYELYRVGHLTDSDIDSEQEMPWFKFARRSGLRFSSLKSA